MSDEEKVPTPNEDVENAQPTNKPIKVVFGAGKYELDEVVTNFVICDADGVPIFEGTIDKQQDHEQK